MSSGSDASFDGIVERMATRARADRGAWQRDGWTRAAEAIAGHAAPFVEWARDHRRWRYVVAEAGEVVCAKPREAAAWILHAIVEELLEEGE
ncbi:MAG TPA: hypothetical protein VN947_15430 [Polyangia bacterium]|nr:hypothetical protein [Polyangia bacterium]